jgi:hypothetical protein
MTENSKEEPERKNEVSKVTKTAKRRKIGEGGTVA